MSTTPNYGWPLIATNQASPEVTHNAAMDLIDAALGGLFTKAMSDADYTLNVLAVPSEASDLFYEFTGTLTADRYIIIPDNKKLYAFWNHTTNPYNLIITTAGSPPGGTVTIPYSATEEFTLCYCDGVNVNFVGVPGPVGATGATGAIGSTGATGADSTVPGPTGPAGSGGGYPTTFVPPAPVASWTKYDSGSTGVFTDLTEAVMISSVAGNAWKFLYTAAPGVPFTLTAAFFYNMENGFTSHYPQASLFVSSSSAMRPFGAIAGGVANPAGLWVGGWNSFTSQAADAKSPYQNFMPTLLWLRIQYDGTNLSFWMSTNGQDWIVQFTEVCSSGILGAAPVNIGFGVNNYSSGSIPAIITLVHWDVTTP